VNWFWHALWICLIVIPTTILWLACVYDIVFRRRSMSAWARVIWLLIVLVLPVVGAVIYLVAFGDALGREDSYRDLTIAKSRGLLSESEYEDQRARLDADPGAR
jgi:hypothetical protein